ncbi:MAG TPA: hypothetical protein VD993_14185 [Chitinophagaceae bacterium]|nr:hypothetical protein [Chitinophagaceae bacterium]
MNKFTSLLLFLAFNFIIGCKGQSEQEQKFEKKLSTLYDDSEISLASNTVRNNKGKTSYEFSVMIKKEAGSISQMVANNMQSYPAYLFFNDTISKTLPYDYVNVTINVDGVIGNKKYSMRDLEEVTRCRAAADGFARAIRQKNHDSLTFYIDKASNLLPFLLKELDSAEQMKGPVQDFTLDGFTLTHAGNHSMVNYNMTLLRSGAFQYMQVNVRPVNDKVYNYRLSPVIAGKP